MATKRQLKKQDSMKAKAAQAVEQKTNELKEVTEQKAAEVKKATEEKTAEVKKATEKAVAETKKAVKKVTAKKEIKTTLIVEHQGKQVAEKDMISSVKKAWTKSGKKIGAIKSMTLYVKPEEDAVYYVINDTETGKVQF